MNYGGLTEEFSRMEDSQIVILPVPYDGTSTWIKGSDKGPEAILEASANMELYDIETYSEVYKNGIYTAPAITEKSSPEAMAKAVNNEVLKHLEQDKMVVTIGGEHSVSIGAIRAHQEFYKDVSVLQIDAHTDLRDTYEGSKYNHACVMARARELGPIVQVGIRSMDASEWDLAARENIFFAHDIRQGKFWKKNVINRLTDQVYITIDLDAFDPGTMPSTGTPEPGGLSWYDVMELIAEVNEEKNIIGFDVVELCPNPANKAPDFLAAKLIYRTISMIFNA